MLDINAQIEIKFLADCQEYIPALTSLWYEEIGRHWVKGASIEKAKDRFISHLNKDKMPIAIVAVLNGDPVGMACLRETDGIRPGLTPWLGGLIVDPKFRRIKIGETLIEAIISHARKFEYGTLYLLTFDPTLPNWYARLGWQYIGNDELLEHQVTVMRIPI